MSHPVDRLLEYGGRLLLEHSHCPIAIIDQSAGLITWNATMAQLLARAPRVGSLLQLLDSHSGPRLLDLIEQALSLGRAGPMIINFVDGPAGLPHSYKCQVHPVSTEELILLAEPVAPLDHQAAEQYMRLTNDLAITTRSLQKTRFELERKQRQLEEALARLAQLANIDELTSLLNRRSLLGRLSEEVERSRRYHSPLSVLLMDIDHFKQVNDRYGHPAGDYVLSACARLLQRSIRSTDHLGRYGGEEFLAILPMTGAVAATDLAERLRQQIERAPFTVAATVTFSITISIGVTEFTPPDDSVDLLVAHADSALYQAKAAGRNRHMLWQR